jgi:hypothetical protein
MWVCVLSRILQVLAMQWAILPLSVIHDAPQFPQYVGFPQIHHFDHWSAHTQTNKQTNKQEKHTHTHTHTHCTLVHRSSSRSVCPSVCVQHLHAT